MRCVFLIIGLLLGGCYPQPQIVEVEKVVEKPVYLPKWGHSHRSTYWRGDCKYRFHRWIRHRDEIVYKVIRSKSPSSCRRTIYLAHSHLH